jgi:dolichyl-phosphate beta-glucosyltransferase
LSELSTAPYLTLILPAFDEVNSIKATLEDICRYFASRGIDYQIIVAADGTDGTRELVADMAETNRALRVIGNEQRLGKGKGIRDAIRIADGRFIGYADADNKVPMDDFDKIRPHLDAGYDLVIGSRALEQSKVERSQPLYRQVGSKGFHLFMQTVVGLPGIHDSQCGFKFFTSAAARRIFGMQRIDGYMFDVEILSLAIRLGYRIREVPIRWRDDGDSRLQLFRGNLQNVVDIFRIRLNGAAVSREPERE